MSRHSSTSVTQELRNSYLYTLAELVKARANGDCYFHPSLFASTCPGVGHDDRRKEARLWNAIYSDVNFLQKTCCHRSLALRVSHLTKEILQEALSYCSGSQKVVLEFYLKRKLRQVAES